MTAMVLVVTIWSAVFIGFLAARTYVNRPFSWRMLGILLRKCMLIKLRSKFAWVFELFVPCALSVLTVINSTLFDSATREDIFDSSLVFTAVALCARLSRTVVEERSSGMKELLHFMGMKRWMATGSWGLFYAVPMLLYAILFSIPLCIILGNDWGNMFVYHALFFESLLAFSLFLSSLCPTPNAATVSATLCIVLTRILFEGVAKLIRSSAGTYFIWLECILCLHPIGAYKSGFLRYTDNGDQIITNFLPFKMALLQQVINILLYFTLAWYAERALPKNAGDNASATFFLKGSYWFKSDKDSIKFEEQMKSNENVEPVSGNHVPVICARDLLKTFKHGKETVFAIDHVDITLYSDQTVCILGHKGSGKSTLINLLTGKLKSAHGEIKIGNLLLDENIEEEQKAMGFCPQENTYYDALTVYEHLLLVSQPKGLAKKKQKCHINAIIDSLGLTNEKNHKARSLSWCSKRKLCVAMALIGGSKMMFFDEPTAGMDPESKQIVWSVIKKESRGKVIVLATHCEDEAEILGDRIALMKGGELKCIGSSDFLKEKCHAGYFLEIHTSGISDDVLKRICKIVYDKIPSAKCIDSDDSKIKTFFINFNMDNELQSLFSKISSLSIQYKVTVQTMEQVYTQMNDESEFNGSENSKREFKEYILQDLVDNAKTKSSAVIKFSHDIEDYSVDTLYNLPCLRVQLFATIKKRFLNLIRDYWSLSLTVVVPILIITFAGILYKITGNLYADIILLALLIIPLTPLRFLVMERTSGLKQLQRQSGTNVVLFYIGNLVVDTLPAIITILTSLGILFAIGVNACVNSFKSFVIFSVVLFSYWTSEIVPSYMISLIFNSSKEATIMGILPMLILGYLLPALGLFLEKIGSLMWIKMFIDLQVGSLPPITFKNTVNALIESNRNGTISCPWKAIFMLLQGGIVPVVMVLGIETQFFSFIAKKVKDVLLRKVKLIFRDGISQSSRQPIQKTKRSERGEEEEEESLLENGVENDTQESKYKESWCNQTDETVGKEIANVDALMNGSQDCLRDYPFIVQHVTKVFHGKGKENDHISVDDLTLSIKPGECFCIYGKRNAGKTTLLSLLQEEDIPDTGSLFRNGAENKRFYRVKFQRIGVCVEKDPFVETMTIREHYELIGVLRGIPYNEVQSAIKTMLNVFSTQDYLDRYPSSLTADTRKLLALGLAFMGNPEIVLIDGIFSGVSGETMAVMRNGIQALKHNKTIVIASSSLNDVLSLCDTVGIMARGKMLYLGSFAEFFKRIEMTNVVYIKSEPDIKPRIENIILSSFPKGKIIDESNGSLKLSIEKTDGDLCTLFEKLRKEIGNDVRECVVGENSIEATLTDLERIQYDSE